MAEDAASLTLKTLLAGTAPQLAADKVTMDSLKQQYGAVDTATGATNDYQTAMAGFQQGNINIGAEKLGIQGAGLQAQEQLAGGQNAIEQQQYALSAQQFPEQQKEAQQQFGANMQNMQGSQAASGALNTGGAKQAQDLARSNYQYQQADISRAQQQSQLGQQSALAGQEYQMGKGNTTGQGAQGGEFGRQQSNLNLMAQANGLSTQQLTEQLNYGIAQNNLQGKTSAGQILSQMGNLAAGDITSAGMAMASVAYAGNVNPVVTGLGG